jgi:hypothetical protein
MQAPDAPRGYFLTRVEEFAPVLAVVDGSKVSAAGDSETMKAVEKRHIPFKLVLRLPVPGVTLVISRRRHDHSFPLACACA